jgi:hypothetical protein
MTYETITAIGGPMLVRISPDDKHLFPLGLQWRIVKTKYGDRLEAECDARCLYDHGLTLHWTHDDWRLAKIHSEHGWKQIGCGKEGSYYAIILKESTDGK